MTDDLKKLAVGILEAQPFSCHLGARIEDVGSGEVTMSLAIRDELRQQHGFVHGGVLSYLADNAITFAGGLALGGDALTSEFKINYVRPAVGETLLARAFARNAGKRQAVCQCEIVAIGENKETLCAIALGTVIAVRA